MIDLSVLDFDFHLIYLYVNMDIFGFISPLNSHETKYCIRTSMSFCYDVVMSMSLVSSSLQSSFDYQYFFSLVSSLNLA